MRCKDSQEERGTFLRGQWTWEGTWLCRQTHEKMWVFKLPTTTAQLQWDLSFCSQIWAVVFTTTLLTPLQRASIRPLCPPFANPSSGHHPPDHKQLYLSCHVMPMKKERWGGGWALGSISPSWRRKRYKKVSMKSLLEIWAQHDPRKGLANKQKAKTALTSLMINSFNTEFKS